MIKITKCAGKFECLINFDRKIGATTDSSEDENNVMVTSTSSSSSHQDSQLIATLKTDEECVAKALKGGKLIVIDFNSLSIESYPISASVQISRYRKCKHDANCYDYDACTTSECVDYDRRDNGRCVYHNKTCDECGTNIIMSSTTNEFADHFSWEIINTESNRIFMSSESNLSPYTTYTESKCLPFGDYSIIARYSENQKKSENVLCLLQAAGVLIYDISTNEEFEFEEFFTVCSSDSDCIDYDGCTIDVCDPKTKLCENKVLKNADCIDCTLVTLELKLDNYPDETSWDLASSENKNHISVLSGK